DVDVGDDDGAQPREFFRDENALLESAVGELQSGHNVTDGVHTGDVRRESFVRDDEAAIHGDADLFEAEPRRRWATAHGNEKDVGFDGLAVFEGHDNTRVAL